MTSLPGLHRGENGGEEVAGGNATQQCAIACRSPENPHTGNNKWFYFYPCDFLFPSGQSIWLMLSINILLKCDKANESFNCCGTGGGSLACIYWRLNVTTDWFALVLYSKWRNILCALPDSAVNEKAACGLTRWALIIERGQMNIWRNVWNKMYFFGASGTTLWRLVWL